MSRNLWSLAAILGALIVAGCSRQSQSPVSPTAADAASADARAGGTGTKLRGDVVVGDAIFAAEDASPIASTCSTQAGNTWSLDFGHTQCLVVRPVWSPDSSYQPYALTDDVKVITLQDRSSKLITHVRLLAQDVIGDAGIQHDTDWIPLAAPAAPAKGGGTLHVHAANVEVWRLSGHTGGTRVEMIGRISIGDLVYR